MTASHWIKIAAIVCPVRSPVHPINATLRGFV
jgi:hypothetical protein